jgi:hypothetical protein
MTEFEGEWAAGGGTAVILVSLLPTASGTTKVSISAEGGCAEMLVTPGVAVELARELLTIAAAEAGTAAQVDVGAGFGRVQSGPNRKAWLFKT